MKKEKPCEIHTVFYVSEIAQNGPRRFAPFSYKKKLR